MDYGGVIMTDHELVFRQRRRIFEEWRMKRLTWQEVKEKYGFSKKWFYKWRYRYHKHGDEGLRNKPKNKPVSPYVLDWGMKQKILDYVFENPTHGPQRIAMEITPKICAKTVWNVLKSENINTRRKRKYWAEDHGKMVLTKKEKLVRLARHNHIESSSPGELVCMDTFWCNVKSVGKVWQFTACDAYSSFGWAKVYFNRYCDNSCDFFENHVLRSAPQGKIKRVLSDRGTEFYPSNTKSNNHPFAECLKKHGATHSVTKVAHPWTNGYAERLNQTIWQEFYLCRLSKAFTSLEELNRELQDFMRWYNFRRKHTGYKLRERGLVYPYQAFFEVPEKLSVLV